MIDLYYIDWDAVTSITGVLMMIVAFITMWVTYRQRRDDLRARLSFEIISWREMFLLKITNIGKECAYNIQIKFNGEFLDNHFSKEVKDNFIAVSSKPFTMAAGRDLYYYLTPIYHEHGCSFRIGKENFSSQNVNAWLAENKNSKLNISGKYCNRYSIKESLSINEFIVGKPLVVEDVRTVALEQISKGLSCKNDYHRPIQEKIDDISKSLETLVKNTK